MDKSISLSEKTFCLYRRLLSESRFLKSHCTYSHWCPSQINYIADVRQSIRLSSIPVARLILRRLMQASFFSAGCSSFA